ncbi:TPA: hypothetical protein DEO28_04515 [Candidatus Dependentiae bacterium]|nr:MAG: hypothetical protein UR14_C0002G0021 [candidate division TM6 bacterium GW2011_GWE2_31_21]KKP53818.1 MAG: hypothetical protein UR43_C0002G0021 [candidate division TM6 bacterium GW2011_GWF2_33_332]HBS47598.1 hypothetical protein [Candidatus Dependentiae bacterium]HBZ73747.1 hypothetical protein [Candidatus Dependentiae bacterium]
MKKMFKKFLIANLLLIFSTNIFSERSWLIQTLMDVPAFMHTKIEPSTLQFKEQTFFQTLRKLPQYFKQAPKLNERPHPFVIEKMIEQRLFEHDKQLFEKQVEEASKKYSSFFEKCTPGFKMALIEYFAFKELNLSEWQKLHPFFRKFLSTANPDLTHSLEDYQFLSSITEREKDYITSATTLEEFHKKCFDCEEKRLYLHALLANHKFQQMSSEDVTKLLDSTTEGEKVAGIHICTSEFEKIEKEAFSLDDIQKISFSKFEIDDQKTVLNILDILKNELIAEGLDPKQFRCKINENPKSSAGILSTKRIILLPLNQDPNILKFLIGHELQHYKNATIVPRVLNLNKKLKLAFARSEEKKCDTFSALHEEEYAKGGINRFKHVSLLPWFIVQLLEEGEAYTHPTLPSRVRYLTDLQIQIRKYKQSGRILPLDKLKEIRSLEESKKLKGLRFLAKQS